MLPCWNRNTYFRSIIITKSEFVAAHAVWFWYQSEILMSSQLFFTGVSYAWEIQFLSIFEISNVFSQYLFTIFP